jgi:hypothetical protein
LLMRDRKFSRRFSVPQTPALAPFPPPTGRLPNVKCLDATSYFLTF